MKKIITLLALVILVSGCANFNVIKYNDRVNYPPTNPDAVRLFNSDPPQAFEKIGELKCDVAMISSYTAIRRRIQEEGAKLGADAVVVNMDNRNQIGPSMYTGVAIKFKEEKPVSK